MVTLNGTALYERGYVSKGARNTAQKGLLLTIPTVRPLSSASPCAPTPPVILNRSPDSGTC
jgi:hypothetical protein